MPATRRSTGRGRRPGATGGSRVIDATARNSWTKSRSLTASIEFANARRMPSRSAVAAGSSPSVEVAVAPAPNADVDARSAHCANRSRSREHAHACASRWWPSVTGWARRAWVVPGITVASCSRARSTSTDTSAAIRPSIRAAASSSHRRRSVTTRSLRDRPAWSLAPRSPRRSVTSRSTTEWMSSSASPNTTVPAARSSPTSASVASSVSASSAVSSPAAMQRADMRSRGANVRLTQPLVEVQRPSQGVRLGCRRRREPSRPQRAALAHAPRSPWVADHVLRPRPYSRTNPAASDWSKASPLP